MPEAQPADGEQYGLGKMLVTVGALATIEAAIATEPRVPDALGLAGAYHQTNGPLEGTTDEQLSGAIAILEGMGYQAEDIIGGFVARRAEHMRDDTGGIFEYLAAFANGAAVQLMTDNLIATGATMLAPFTGVDASVEQHQQGAADGLEFVAASYRAAEGTGQLGELRLRDRVLGRLLTVGGFGS